MTIRDIDRLFETAPVEDITFQKIDAAHAAARTPYGYNDPQAAGEILHAALYDQQAISSLDFAALSTGHQQTLCRPFTHFDTVPSKQAFAEVLYETIITQGTPQRAFHPGARTAVEAFYHDPAAQVIPWTQGHVEQQVSKVAALGVALAEHPFARQLHDAHTEPRLEMHGVVSTDKFNETALTKLRQLTAGRQLIVAEDRPRNILRLQHTPGFEETLGIWVVHGSRATAARNRINDSLSDSTNEERAFLQGIQRQAIRPITGPHEMTKALYSWAAAGVIHLERPYSIILDFDDTLINSRKREQLQHTATLSTLITRRWVTGV